MPACQLMLMLASLPKPALLTLWLLSSMQQRKCSGLMVAPIMVLPVAACAAACLANCSRCTWEGGTTVVLAPCCRTPDLFAGHKLRKGSWVAVRMRITAFAVERLDAAGGTLCPARQLMLAAERLH